MPEGVTAAADVAACPKCGGERRAMFGRDVETKERLRSWFCPRCLDRSKWEPVAEDVKA